MRINSTVLPLKAVGSATSETGKKEEKALNKPPGILKEESTQEKPPVLSDKEISLLLTFHDNSLGLF